MIVSLYLLNIFINLKGYRFVILDVPLLFEAKAALKFISYKIVVDCDEETQLQRLLQRNPELSKQDALNRIKSQMGRKEKLKLADIIIDNSGDLKSTRKQVEKAYEIFNKSKKHWIMRSVLSLGGLFLISIFYSLI